MELEILVHKSMYLHFFKKVRNFDDLKKEVGNGLHNFKAALNNLGFTQQDIGQIQDYILSTDINFTEEELRKMCNTYLQKQLVSFIVQNKKELLFEGLKKLLGK